jgi:hypothetical protein
MAPALGVSMSPASTTSSDGRQATRPVGMQILLAGDILFVLPYLFIALNVIAHPAGPWNGLSRLAAPKVTAFIALFFIVVTGAWFRNAASRHLTIILLGFFAVLNVWQSGAILAEMMVTGIDVVKAFQLHFWAASLGFLWCLWFSLHVWYFYVRPGDDFYGRTVSERARK